MENKERKPKIIAVDRRGYHGVTLTRKAAERYGFERMLRLPGNYRKIEAEAFKGNLKIEQMELADSVLELGADAFRSCNALKEAVLPGHLAVIGEGCFAECPQLWHVKIPSYVDTIKDATFFNDKRLQKVEFAAWSRLTRIGAEAFMECKTLERIDLPDSIQQIGDRALRRCKMLADIHFPANLKDIGEETFYFCAANELQLPKKVEFIGRRAFCKWTFLEQVSLPESVQYIGDGAFRGCNRLKVLEIRHEPEYLGELITNRNVTIRCKKDSKVEAYAKEFGYPIEYIE